MAYNLPPPWNPGFVLPKNVEDEGLQRQAFITKWQPRGSYDNPKVGTGGYAVPQYVEDEGYGQGTFTTKWQPSGSYSGPKVPVWLNQRPKVVTERQLPGGGKVVSVQPLSDDEPMPALFEDYGSRAAQMLIAQVAPFPPGRRAMVMKTILDKVDKSLWTRTQDIFKRYISQGVPPAVAFPQALARAMSTGIAAEFINTGLRRAAPQASSLLGLGCYGNRSRGHSALGAAPTRDSGSKTGASGGGANKTVLTLQQQAAAADAATYAYCQANPTATRCARPSDTGGGILTGIINIPTTIITTAGDVVATGAGAVYDAGGAVVGGVTTGANAVYDAGGAVVGGVVTGANAVYDAGGAVVGGVVTGANAVYDAGGAVVGGVVDAGKAIGDAVMKGLDKLGDLACGLVNTPGVASAAGAVGGMVVGVPPMAGAAAGAAGAKLAKGSCGGDPPPPPPPVVTPSSILPLALLGGGAVILAFFLMDDKRTKKAKAK